MCWIILLDFVWLAMVHAWLPVTPVSQPAWAWFQSSNPLFIQIKFEIMNSSYWVLWIFANTTRSYLVRFYFFLQLLFSKITILFITGNGCDCVVLNYLLPSSEKYIQSSLMTTADYLNLPMFIFIFVEEEKQD